MMKRLVEKFYGHCIECRQAKSKSSNFGLYTPLPSPTHPWVDISIDFVFPKRNDSIFVVMDRLSKMAHFIPCRKTIDARLGTKLLFSTIAHPQTYGQTEVVNHSLGTLLRALVFENKTSWEECLPIAEFAYNRTLHSTTQLSPFEVVYGFNPLTPLDLSMVDLSLPCMLDVGSGEKAKFVKDLHVQVQKRIRRKGEQVVLRVNKERKKMVFQPGDCLWVHFRKIHFPDKTRGKLAPRGDGPFLVLERINDNAYVIDLPGEYNVSCTFNMADLSPYDLVRNPDLMTNPSQEGENDANPLRLEGRTMTRAMTRCAQEGLSNPIQKVVQEESSRSEVLAMKHILSAGAGDSPVRVALMRQLSYPAGCHQEGYKKAEDFTRLDGLQIQILPRRDG
ncbi:hypothetical protein AAHA92_01193 [Salvia divinorum]|uniref:Tf2-1-like SH3-like domain-containing protein n=1 Tax=Salvia divinorum TaxID=28513 RepID=A0ABD1IPH9_SALDI